MLRQGSFRPDLQSDALKRVRLRRARGAERGTSLLALVSKWFVTHSCVARMRQLACRLAAPVSRGRNDEHLRSILPIPIRGSERFVSGVLRFSGSLGVACRLGRTNGSHIVWSGVRSHQVPKRLNKAVLIAPGGTVLRFSTKFFLQLFVAAISFAAIGGRWCVRPLFRWLFADWARTDPERFEAEVDWLVTIMRSLQRRDSRFRQY